MMPEGPTAAPADERYRHPTYACDLVMKGGVTSGVGYPAAVLRLAPRYRFRSIGGTSAGAIAAAAVAAAEYGREALRLGPDGRLLDGFQRFAEVRAWLRDAERKNLFHLFQPSTATRPLMDTIFGGGSRLQAIATAFDEKRRRGALAGLGWVTECGSTVNQVGAVLRDSHPTAYRRGAAQGALWAAVAGAALAALVALLAALIARLTGGAVSWWSLAAPILLVGALFGALGWWLGGPGGAAADLVRILLREVPANYFGMCSGRAETPGGPEALTDWLHARLNDLAGLPVDGAPLTFKQLREKPNVGDQEAGITVMMVTTNLSHRQPYVFPMERNLFLWKRADLERFFPPPVITYMEREAHGQQAPPDERYPLEEGFFFLPEGDKLPLVVAARMSLSFPVLISAVRLWTIKESAWQEYRTCRDAGRPFVFTEREHLQANWFSDGGISSNFPIHLFDSWLPSRPTFGIKLTAKEKPAIERMSAAAPRRATAAGGARRARGAGEPATPPPPPLVVLPDDADVYLPRPRQPVKVDWSPVEGLLSFGVALFDTAQNFRDNMQAALPGYRERVVQLRLADNEGGLNLDMDATVIERLDAKGDRAGAELLAFGQERFPEHQWVRLRVLLAQLEGEAIRIKRRHPSREGYRKLIAEQVARAGGADPWYRQRRSKWCASAVLRIDRLFDLIDAWEQDEAAWRADPTRAAEGEEYLMEQPLFGQDPPAPPSVLRATPPL